MAVNAKDIFIFMSPLDSASVQKADEKAVISTDVNKEEGNVARAQLSNLTSEVSVSTLKENKPFLVNEPISAKASAIDIKHSATKDIIVLLVDFVLKIDDTFRREAEITNEIKGVVIDKKILIDELEVVYIRTN